MKFKTSRRSFLKTSAVGAALGALGAIGSRMSEAAPSNKSQLKIAGCDYDRVRAITNGQVGIPGRNIAFEYQDIYTVNQSAFGPDRTYDVTELGLIPYIQKFGNENFRAYTLVPVFISRIYRHRSVYVHVDAGIEEPEYLRGKRIGTPRLWVECQHVDSRFSA